LEPGSLPFGDRLLCHSLVRSEVNSAFTEAKIKADIVDGMPIKAKKQ